MEKNKYRLIGIALIILGLIVLAISTGTIKMPGATTVSVMDASLMNATGIVEVIIELQTPPGTMATVQSQDVFIQDVQALNGAVTDTVIYVDNAIKVTIDAQQLDELASNPNVKSITRNRELWFAPQSVDTMNGISLTDNRYSILDVLPLWEQGLTGNGVVVAVVDTGINSDLDIFMRDGKSIVIDSLQLYGEYVMWHGTAVASCIASQDTVIKGIAPGVNLLNVEVFKPDGGAWTWDIIKGWDWVAKWKTNHPETYVICCNSLGASPIGLTGGWKAPGDLDRPANKMVLTYNIPMIVAAGNGHPEAPSTMKINCPGQAQYVLTVGATDFDNRISYFSCRGGTIDGNPKPDVVAPGVNIRMFNDKGSEITASGTSFSTPLTAGVAALLAEQHKNYTAWQLENSIKNGANRNILPTAQYDTTYGYGLVDAQAATVINPSVPSPTGEISNVYLLVIIVIIGAVLVLYPTIKKRK
jgi:serine protease AprX